MRKKVLIISLVLALLTGSVFAERTTLFGDQNGTFEMENWATFGLAYSNSRLDFTGSGLYAPFSLKVRDHLVGVSFEDVTLLGNSAIRFGGIIRGSIVWGGDSMLGGTHSLYANLSHLGFNFSIGPAVSFEILPFLSIYDGIGPSLNFNAFSSTLGVSKGISFLTFGLMNDLGIKVNIVKGLSLQLNTAILVDFGGIYTVNESSSNNFDIEGKYFGIDIQPSISIAYNFTKVKHAHFVSKEYDNEVINIGEKTTTIY